MRGRPRDVCGCFPTGQHYPGIADLLAKSVVKVKGLARGYALDADWRTAALAVIDFETTGLSSETDRILEVGVVTFDGGELTSRYQWLVDPGVPIPEEARKVHGISDEELKGAPPMDEVFAEVLRAVKGRIPVAYNAEFDRSFLHAEWSRVALRLGGTMDEPPALKEDVVWVDPLVWVRELQKYEKGKKLTDVCKRLGVTIESAHRATDDAEATGLVLQALAKDMPPTYGELIRIQSQYAAQQEADFAAWRSRRK